jgi:hypothetical protein
MKQLAMLSLAILVFQFAPNRIIAPPLKGSTVIFAPVSEEPGLDRKCTSEERRLCVSECASIPPLHKPEDGWNPGLALAVGSCSVRTIDSRLTRVCSCVDPGTYTMVETSCESPKS